MISVILPALNEEEGIVRSLKELSSVPLGEGSEILVIDDASVDQTGARAADLGARVVRHVTNQGYGRSLKDGIAAARNDTLVIADADGSYPFDRIPALIEEYEKGFDMVVGVRQGLSGEPPFKIGLRFLLKGLVEFTAGTRVPDVNSGMRVFSKKTISKELPLLSNGFSFTTSLTLCYLMRGRFVAHLPIAYNARVGRSKVRLLRDSLRTLQFIVQAMVYFNPLKAFLLPCIACLALSGGAFLAAIAGVRGAFSLGFEALLAAIVIFSLGLFAVMLRQASDE